MRSRGASMLRGARVAPLAIAMLLALAGTRAARAQEPGEERETENGDVVRARFEYFYQQRRYPFDRIPLRYTRAEMLRLRSGGVSGGGLRLNELPNTVSAWSPLGPRPIQGSYSGRVTALAIDPRDSRVAYVGGAQGGVWKTTDAGATWTPLTDQQCSLAIGSITLDPVNPDIVYAGTGEQNFSGDSYYGCGVLRSTDGGTTWAQLGSTEFDRANGGATVAKVLVDRATAGSATGTTVLAATSLGLWRSTNSGASWTRVLTTGYGWVTDVVADPNDPRVVYAASTSIYSSPANGVYKSTDGGVTFQRLSAFPTTGIGRIALAVAASGPATATLYAAVENASSGDLLGIYRTTDGGATWSSTGSATATLACNRQCWYDLVLTVDPVRPDTLYLGTVDLFRSADGGATFTDVTRSIHVDQHALAIDPTNPATLWAGNDGGAYRSIDGGSTWGSVNQTLALTQFYPGVSLATGSTLRILGGTQDNGTVEYGGFAQWSSAIGGDGGYTATDPSASGVAYGETQWVASSGYSGPRKRLGTGSFFAPSTSGIDLGEPGLFIAPLVLDRARPSTLYFGTKRLYRSRDGAATWNPLLTLGQGMSSAIGVAPSDSQTVYVGSSSGGVLVTRDGGATWAAPGGGLPTRFVTDIVVHGADPSIAYATVSGFGSGHVFRTSNGGASWSDVSGNLPDIPVNALVLLPGGELDVGTDLGVFRSGDGGATWTPFVGGLPNVAVTDLAYNRAASTLVAATHGRGAFAATVNVVAPATALWVDQQPDSASSGHTLRPIAVSIREAAGSLVSDASAVVSVRVASGSVVLHGTTSVATSGGVATFSDLIVDGTGPVVLAFSASGLSSASTKPIAVVAATGLSLTPAARHAVMIAGAAAARQDSLDIVLGGTAAATQPWSATHVAAWSTLERTNGVGPARLRWSRSAVALGAGTFVDTITVTADGADGSPARVVDTLVVLASAPATVVSLRPDTLRGATGSAAAADLMVDVAAGSPLTLGAYDATITWDSTVVSLDSVSAAEFGAPTVKRLSAGAVRVSGSGTASSGGALAVARLRLRLVGAVGSTSSLQPSATALTASGADAFDLLPWTTTRAGAAVVGGVLRGDVDGDGRVTAADARLILVAVVGGALPDGAAAYPAGDVDCDGQVTARDAQIVLAYAAGKPVNGVCVGSVR